jgi:flavodoxin
MEYKNIHIIYFSPTHTSAKTAYAIAEGLSGDVLLESDITYDAPAEELEIHDDELTIVAAPVYGGPRRRWSASVLSTPTKLRSFRSWFTVTVITRMR